MKSTRRGSDSPVHRREKTPRFQIPLDKWPVSPGTPREASGVPWVLSGGDVTGAYVSSTGQDARDPTASKHSYIPALTPLSPPCFSPPTLRETILWTVSLSAMRKMIARRHPRIWKALLKKKKKRLFTAQAKFCLSLKKNKNKIPLIVQSVSIVETWNLFYEMQYT